MRKILATLLVVVMLISLSACASDITTNSPDDASISSRDDDTSVPSHSDDKNGAGNETERQNTVKALDETVSKDVESTIDNLYAEYEKLVTDIDTYDRYIENAGRVEQFYERVYEDTRQLCNRMYEYSINYAELILESDQSNSGKYDDLEMIYDNIYEDAGDDIYDEIYDGILDDMYSDFYDGILDDAYDSVPYREWSDIRSDEYDWWTDARSDVYRKWSDFRSDVYNFWSDMRSAVYRDNIEKAEKEIADFKEDIERIQNRNK